VCAMTTRYYKNLKTLKTKWKLKKEIVKKPIFFDIVKIRFIFFIAQVPKCLYRVRAGEALVDIALKFGTSWLQVFFIFDSPPSPSSTHTHILWFQVFLCIFFWVGK
jgi:hypothetical protein